MLKRKGYMKHVIATAWVSLALVGGAQARDLVQVYDDAVQFDPQIHEGDATRMAAGDNRREPWGAIKTHFECHGGLSAARCGPGTVLPLPNPTTPAVLLPLPFS